MALGPEKLREPNTSDEENVRYLEQRIDNSPEFANFRSGTVKVYIGPVLMKRFLGNREHVRKLELTRRYQQAGWFSVRFMENEIEFSEVDVSMGRS